MPQYNFQPRFVSFVKEGSKTHTVRDRRKYPAKIGDPVYLFTGLRTKWSTRLVDTKCSNTHSLAIYNYGIVFYSRLLDKIELQVARESPFNELLPVKEILSIQECEKFAWRDGFRPEGTTEETPEGAFELMLGFWNQKHATPWAGDIIYWLPSKPALYGKAL